MKHSFVPVVACALLAIFAVSANAQEKVRLECKLQPGTEATYDYSVEERPAGGGKRKTYLTGQVRLLIADFVPASGERLALLWSEGEQYDPKQDKLAPVRQFCIGRWDRSGRATQQLPEKNAPWLARLLHERFFAGDAEFFQFPAEPVAVGQEWPCEAVLADPFNNSRTRGISVITKLADLNGSLCAVVKTATASTPVVDIGRMKASAVVDDESWFDLNLGLSRKETISYQLRERHAAISEMRWRIAAINVRVLPLDETARAKKCALELEKIIGQLSRGETAQAQQALDAFKAANAEDNWLNAAASIAGAMKRIAEHKTE